MNIQAKKGSLIEKRIGLSDRKRNLKTGRQNPVKMMNK